MNYDKYARRFTYNRSSHGIDNISMDYEMVYQVLEDKDGSIWIATDKGLYYTPTAKGTASVTNVIFKNDPGSHSITDILELPDGDLWFTSWGNGIRTVDKFLTKTEHDVYRQPPPAQWNAAAKNATKLTWAMCREKASGDIWIGCNSGVLMIHNPAKKKTTYLNPSEANNSTIRYIAQNKAGEVWLGTQGGRLIKWSDNKFTIVYDVGTIIYKIFFDDDGWLWLATHEKGLYAIDPVNGKCCSTIRVTEAKTGYIVIQATTLNN
jgi:ligand-binding sensor domain-containing protein